MMMNKISFWTILFWACCATVHSAEPTAFRFPRSTPEAQGVHSEAILDFIETADRELPDMNSFMLLRHGQVVAEGWWTPYNADSRHELYSLSKSFTSTAAGLAIAEGKFSLDDFVISFFPDDLPAEKSDKLRNLRVRHLLSMATGHESEPQLAAQDQPWTKTFLGHPLEFEPGTHFLYNTPSTYMVSAIVQKQTGQTVLEYLQPRLFAPLGIEGARWGTSPQGISLGGYGLNIRTEDIARLGQLYLQKGLWNGKQLLPASWVEMATSKQIDNGNNPESDWNQGYGFQFWRCRHDCYRGDGAFGQYCVMMPNQDAVIAITSGVKNMQAVLDLVWDKLLPAMESAALPDAPVSQEKLQIRLASLQVPIVAGRAACDTAKSISGKKYTLTDAPGGLQMLSLRTSVEPGAEPVLIVRRDGIEQEAACGYQRWVKGSLPLRGAGSQPVAISGAWTADDTFTVKVCFFETPHTLTLQLKFTGEEVRVDSEMNVDFGPTKYPSVIGKVQP